MKKAIKQIMAYTLSFAIAMPVFVGIAPNTAAAEGEEDVYSPTMTVDMTDELGEMLHGAVFFME